jgi:hypothetical protein
MARFSWNAREEERLLRSVGGPVAKDLRHRADRGAGKAKELCPVSPEGSNGNPPGHLRDSIDSRSGVDGEGLFAEYGTDVEYALPVELGSKPHIIKSKGDYPLRDQHGNVFGRQVNHPGTEAQPYLRPAISAMGDE